MPHFLKDRTTISDAISLHASFTHWQTVGNDAAFTLPPFVKDFFPLDHPRGHLLRRRSLNGLLSETSSGWITLVSPPGMTAVEVLFSFKCCFAWSTRQGLTSTLSWSKAEHRLHLSIRLGPPKPVGNLAFGKVFLLKITIRFNIVPSTRHASTTLKRSFPWPVTVLMRIVVAPRESIVFAAVTDVTDVLEFIFYLSSSFDHKRMEFCDFVLLSLFSSK